MEKKPDTYSGQTWLCSDKLIKRSFAVMGHYILAMLMIYGIILLTWAVIGLIGLMFSL